MVKTNATRRSMATWGGLHPYRFRFRRAMAGLPDAPPPGGVLLAPVPLCPPACRALDPDELEDRIARYARRAAQRLPLFEGRV